MSRDGSDRSATLSRREALELGAVGAIGGLAGCLDAPSELSVPEPAPAEPPADADQAPDVPEWPPTEPRLRTPWTGDVDPTNPLPEYPRPQLTRDRWRSLNGIWEFRAADEGEPPPTGRPLPESILVPFPVESALSGIHRHESRMWYRRTFDLPAEWDGRTVLHFEAVDWSAAVYLNGEAVARHAGGYDSFSVDVTDALVDAGEQELVVGVYDPTDEGTQPLGKQRLDPGGIYYTACSGIWDSVWLEPVPETHVGSLDVTPDVADGAIELAVDAANADGATVRAWALDGGTVVASATGGPADRLRLSIPDPRLWTPETPHLYDLVVELERDGRTDVVGSYAGLRSVGVERIDGTSRLTLNGEFRFRMGTLDQGYWPDGVYRAPTDEALKSDLRAHKELGFNAVRKHVKVEPRRWYHWADRLGLLVWQDMPSTAIRGDPDPARATREQFEAELRAMVEEYGNHPSVTMWVPFNEGWGSYDVERISEAIRRWDPDRLVDSQSGVDVCRGGGGDVDPGPDADAICGTGAGSDVVDVHAYPGPEAPRPTSDRAAVLGEYGGVGLSIPGHLWSSEESYAYASASDPAALTEAYVEKIEAVRRFMDGCGGLSAAIYTQLSDVETEINGLVTYDRAVVKPDGERLRRAHAELIGGSADVTASAASDGTGAGPDGVAYWPFDEGSGTVAADAAGDHDGELRDLLGEPPRWTDGRVGGALAFDGDTDSVEIGVPVIDTSRAFSVAAWVRLDSLYRTQTAVSQDAASASAVALGYDADEERLAFGAPGSEAFGDEPVSTGEWYHLAGVVTGCGGQARLYVDGERAGTSPTGVSSGRGPTAIGRGKVDGVFARFWDGLIDEVRVYDRAIGVDTVSRLADGA